MATPVVLEQNGLRFDLTSVIEWVGQGILFFCLSIVKGEEQPNMPSLCQVTQQAAQRRTYPNAGNTTCPVTGELLKSPIRLPLDVELQAEIQGFGAVHDLPLHHPDITSVQQRRMAKAFERRSSLDVDQLLGLLCLG